MFCCTSIVFKDGNWAQKDTERKLPRGLHRPDLDEITQAGTCRQLRLFQQENQERAFDHLFRSFKYRILPVYFDHTDPGICVGLVFFSLFGPLVPRRSHRIARHSSALRMEIEGADF